MFLCFVFSNLLLDYACQILEVAGAKERQPLLTAVITCPPQHLDKLVWVPSIQCHFAEGQAGPGLDYGFLIPLALFPHFSSATQCSGAQGSL